MKSEEEIQNAIELHADMVRKICVLHMKQWVDAEDMLQTVFLEYAQSEPFRDREHEKAWLLKVTMNAYRERFRGWFHKRANLQTEVEVCADLSETSHFLLDTLDQFPPHYRDVLHLSYYEGYRVRGMPEIKGKNENTTHTWLKRGREALCEKPGSELDDFR